MIPTKQIRYVSSANHDSGKSTNQFGEATDCWDMTRLGISLEIPGFGLTFMVKPGVLEIHLNDSCELGGDLMNLPPDPGEKGSERQMASFGTTQTLGRITKTKKANDRDNCVVLGENGSLGVPMVPKRPIIAFELPNRLAGCCCVLVSGSDLPYPINGLTGPKG